MSAVVAFRGAVSSHCDVSVQADASVGEAGQQRAVFLADGHQSWSPHTKSMQDSFDSPSISNYKTIRGPLTSTWETCWVFLDRHICMILPQTAVHKPDQKLTHLNWCHGQNIRERGSRLLRCATRNLVGVLRPGLLCRVCV